MITVKIHRTLVSSDSSGHTPSGDGRRVESFPRGRITSSAWEGWWHEDPQAGGTKTPRLNRAKGHAS